MLTVLSGRHVDSSTMVDALRSGAELQQGSPRHRATGPVDLVQLLSAAVDGTGLAPQDGLGAQRLAGTSLGLLPATVDSETLITRAVGSQPSSTGSPDALLLLTTAGAALALAGTAAESARRQRARTAVARGRGRRALR